MWKFTGDAESVMEADFIPYCIFCGSEMEAAFTRLQQFHLHPWEEDESPIAHALDIVVKCPNEDCGWNSVFGVPVTKEDYDKASQQV